MKRFFASFVLSAAMLPCLAEVIGGINYEIDAESKTATVVESETKYEGAISIPASIKVGGIDYSVTRIGEHAFRSCSGLTSIVIPNSVDSIGRLAFDRCKGLTSVSISNSVRTITNYAFYGCSALTTISIPSSVTTIEESAFRSCESLTTINIPNSVRSIGKSAFSGCM